MPISRFPRKEDEMNTLWIHYRGNIPVHYRDKTWLEYFVDIEGGQIEIKTSEKTIVTKPLVQGWEICRITIEDDGTHVYLKRKL